MKGYINCLGPHSVSGQHPRPTLSLLLLPAILQTQMPGHYCPVSLTAAHDSLCVELVRRVRLSPKYFNIFIKDISPRMKTGVRSWRAWGLAGGWPGGLSTGSWWDSHKRRRIVSWE